MKNTVIAVVVAVVVSGGAGYWFGNSHAQSAMAQRAGRFAQLGQGPAGAGDRQVFGGGVSGDVLSKDANGITVKSQDGGSRVVIIPASATVQKSAAGTLDDVTVGERVTIIGSANSDGSVTAQTIQIRPAMPSPSVSPR